MAYNRARHTLYASTGKQLIAIDTKTGASTPVVTLDTGTVTTIGDIGFPGLRIDTTGAGTVIATTDPIGRWAGISVYSTAVDL